MDKKKVGLPPLDWLRVFEAAGRLGGFSAAAREFGLSPAAVSQRIANLESWLGRSLFIRRARGVTLLPELAAMTLQDSSRALLRPLKKPVPAREVSLITHGEGIKTRLLEVLKMSILQGLPQGIKEKRETWRILDAKTT